MKNALFAVLLIVAALSARAQDLDKPLLLVASHDLKGPYHHTALLVVPLHDRHVGFILNRATEMTLAKLFPEHAPSTKVADPVYLGGPESTNAIFAMVARDPGGAAVHLFEDVFITAQAKAVDRIIEQTPNDARYFAGFVGWQPGELAAELDKGWWYAAEPDKGTVFDRQSDGLWETLVERLGKRPPPPEGMRDA
ncbi:MAG: YqgE/AlgH family protein [Betaproteobacteria bacterium]|nr:YqgE/AlgH family protein [Betaproteobacteria bacterium]